MEEQEVQNEHIILVEEQSLLLSDIVRSAENQAGLKMAGVLRNGVLDPMDLALFATSQYLSFSWIPLFFLLFSLAFWFVFFLFLVFLTGRPSFRFRSGAFLMCRVRAVELLAACARRHMLGAAAAGSKP